MLLGVRWPSFASGTSLTESGTLAGFAKDGDTVPLATLLEVYTCLS
jgi:hypothetical protein